MTESLRRRQLIAGGVALVAVGLAGCSDDEDGEENESADGGGGGGGY
jgi:hypothetical protein